MRRSLVLAVLVLASCGSAPSRAESPFCRTFQDVQDANPFASVGGPDDVVAQGVALLDELREVAPVALKDDVRVLKRALDQLIERGPQDMASVITQPEVISAARAVGEVATNDCGIDVTLIG